jgi:hypothetical protein
MTETKPKRRWFRFSIRDLLLLTAIIAIATGWWLDHRRLTGIDIASERSTANPVMTASSVASENCSFMAEL